VPAEIPWRGAPCLAALLVHGFQAGQGQVGKDKKRKQEEEEKEWELSQIAWHIF